MKCGNCQFDVFAEFAFCPRCGNKLDTAAPVVSPVVAEADRRMATVMFADLSGFTAISERLDPEDVRALQTDLLGAMRAVIERYDAFVEKFVGDAVMAVFGAPVAHEDDPQRALHAALEMHACAAELSQRWQGRLGHPLTLHIGINTGRVVAGTLIWLALRNITADWGKAAHNWKEAMNQFAILYEDRFTKAAT